MPVYQAAVDTYYNVDTNGKHPPPPVLCTVHDTSWLFTPLNGGSCDYDTKHSFDEKMAYNRAIINDKTSVQNLKHFIIIFVDPMANESDEDAKLDLMEQFEAEIEDIIKDIKKLREMDSTLKIDGQETFIKTTYYGIEIISRKTDGYVNASKLVMILKNNNSSYLSIWIHPKLINYIAFWAQPKYASTVGEIMDKINERVIAEHNADPNTPIGTHVDNVTSESMNYQQEKIDQLREEKK
ncbi:MAG: hypothetical protein EZS28_022870 [Streblomastix strix]|uniref:KilA/APSES-type HTH DNA-binding domain-containing protein n=1 Tax=Streblomastix strix TaxID=222440 RepID=A0A5J4VGE5_9EUKA|nr:MAG: hypothetical protein EZS28_022870 [Streblomastix strix]